MKHLKIVLIAIITASLAGCSSHRIVSESKNNPTFVANIQAAKRLKKLIHSGSVPSFNKEDHGKIITSRINLNNKSSIEYPAQVSLQVEKLEEKGSIYWFLMEKATADSEWELVEIWKTDERAQNGHYLLKKPNE